MSRPTGTVVIVAGVVLAAQSPAAVASPWAGFITEASQRFGVPEDWIKAVIQAESGGQTHLNGQPIRSKVGAMGLMQLMPGTWADMRQTHNLGGNPDDPRDNILAGTAYLRAMFDRFGYPGLFAAYNAGPARYEAHLRGETLPAETRNYLAAVTLKAPKSVTDPPSLDPSDRGLFAIKREAKHPESRAPEVAIGTHLSQGGEGGSVGGAARDGGAGKQDKRPSL